MLAFAGSALMPMVMPVIQKTTGNITKEATAYLLRQSISQITGSAWGSPASNMLMNSMLSLPQRAFHHSSTPSAHMQHLFNPAQQSSPAQHQQAFQQLQQNDNNSSSQAWALALSSMVALYLEYNGAARMASELPRIKALVAATDGSSQSSLPLVDQTKQLLLNSYSATACYGNTELTGFFTTPEVPNPVRMIFNVLVSLNTSFFTLLGKQSVDPVAEVYHWGAIWFYWEVLARLIRMYGLSPVHIAFSQLHAQLVKQKQTQQQPKPPPTIITPTAAPSSRPAASYVRSLLQRVTASKR